MNDIEDKLPLYLNGQLEGAEKDAVERALAENPDLAREAEFLRALKGSLQQPADNPPGELGLARLKRDLQKEQAQAREQNEPPQTERGTAPAAHKRYWKPMALTACALLGLQTALLLGPDIGSGGTPDSDWAPMSGEPAAASAQLNVVFRADATAEQIGSGLQSINARIVDGPGALGIYKVQLPEGSDPAESRERLEQFDFVEEVTGP